MDEIKLINKAIRGNTKAYGLLIEEYKEVLYRTAFMHVKNEQAALDIVSESVIKGYESVKRLKEAKYFKTWITKIVLNCVNDYFRMNKRHAGFEALEQLAAEEPPSAEEKWDLYEAIDSLSDVYKTVIILKFFEDMKISEIAYAMNIPEGTVKSYLSRAKGELKKYLKEDYVYA